MTTASLLAEKRSAIASLCRQAHVRRVEPPIADRIADLPRSVALRNVLVDGYADVDGRVVWGVVTGPLPVLLATLKTL